MAGALAALPALLLLHWTGALGPFVAAAGVPAPLVLLAGILLGAAAGALYGRVFRRAADDRRGGWLFGMSYGFLLWMLGPIALVQWRTHHPVAVGRAGLALLGAHLLFGLALGLLFVPIHARIQRALEARDRALWETARR